MHYTSARASNVQQRCASACTSMSLHSSCHRRLATALSFRSGAKVALREFAAGGGGAPFPRLRPAPSYAMQHLLIDARVALPQASAAAAAEQRGGFDATASEQPGSVDATAAAAEQPGSVDGTAAAADGFAAVSGLLEASLDDAGLLLQRRQQRSRVGSNGQDGEAADTVTAFFRCQDGYVAAVWHGASASLSGAGPYKGKCP